MICAAYIHDISSVYFDHSVFDNLNNDITKFCNFDTPFILTGDLNSRTGTEEDNFADPDIGSIRIETNNESIELPTRKNCDPIVNSHGEQILNICRIYNLKILNGRNSGDPLGNFTYYNTNLGTSAIDYSLCNQNFYRNVKNFMVLPQNELSDHCKIVTELNLEASQLTELNDNYAWIKLKTNFKWDNNRSQKFAEYLEKSNDEIAEIEQRIEAGLVTSSGEKIQKLFLNSAKKAFDKTAEKVKNRKNSKKWFNKTCSVLKTEVRRLGRQKYKQPLNPFLHEKYRDKLREYKGICQSSRYSFWTKKFGQIEESLNDPTEFWKKWKQCSEVETEKITPRIKGEEWYNYFSTLHGGPSPNPDLNPLPTVTIEKQPEIPGSVSLNKPFTKDELLITIKKLKRGKATGYDRISNEMLKSAPHNVLDTILRYINLCLEKGLISKTLCHDIIYPIFKDGNRKDLGNYRGICISSAILKLITSLLNERLRSRVHKLKLISKNQIGFQPSARTSDHLLTLKSIVKKYVTIGEKKLYACFIDFKKAFDSIWHMGLFHKLKEIGLNGELLSLIENIYKNTRCSVRNNNYITQFFDFGKGVRQGCPLSPLLFNLYVNDIFALIDNSVQTPVYLKEEKVNALMYADDLVILAHTEKELQMSLNNLVEYCKRWKLSINTKKTKCMVFNRGNRICKANISIENNTIENVKSLKYLGFTINSKNCNFARTPVELSIKAKRAIFALNNKIKLSMLPPRLALKIFQSQITPILLYGVEVWAPYGNYNFSNWEKSETEKTHTQYLKRIMGCDIHTPNLMIRGEFGRRPLFCDALKQSLSFIKHVDFNECSLANSALDLEISLDDDVNILSIIRNFTDYFSEQNKYLSPISKLEIKKHVHDNYNVLWKESINLLSKADSYISFKTFIDREKYTSVVKNVKHRIALSRLRLSCHQLMIEKGRHLRPRLERFERKCPSCKNAVEDECHFITSCPLYSRGREVLYTEAKSNAPAFEEIPTDTQKFIFLLSNENTNLLIVLAKYVNDSFKIRASIT